MLHASRTLLRMMGAVFCLLILALALGQNDGSLGAGMGAGGAAGGGAGQPEVGDAFAQGQQLQPPHQKAAIIRLDAPVDDMMRKSIERRLDIASKAGCTLVVFELDTNGGPVQNALDISKIIKELPAQRHMATVAWVHRKAISAGAMISASCQQIVMSSQSTIGDCAPIAIRSTWEGNELVPLPDAERAKFTSPVTQEFDNSAQINGYNPTIFQAMVVVTIEVHEVHNGITGETRYVDTPTKNRLLDEEVVRPDGHKEKPWRFVRTVDDDKSLLTVGAADAQAMKLSRATINTEEELRAAMNVRSEPIVLEFNWAERATVFLTTWPIRLLLFVAMLVFAWVEISHPGLSFAGITAVICLVLLVGAPFLTGLAQVWEIALIVVGLGIIIADLLAFGGLGMLAIPGFILMAIGLVASFVPAEPGGGWMPTMASTWSSLQRGMGVLVGGCFLALLTFYFLSRYLYLTPGFNRLQLVPSGITPSGNGSALTTSQVRDALDQPADDAVFLGAIGMTTTDLRPAGKARFGDHLVNVVSDGLYIPQRQEVEVIELGSMRVVVRHHVSTSSMNQSSELPPPPPVIADGEGPLSSPVSDLISPSGKSGESSPQGGSPGAGGASA